MNPTRNLKFRNPKTIALNKRSAATDVVIRDKRSGLYLHSDGSSMTENRAYAWCGSQEQAKRVLKMANLLADDVVLVMASSKRAV